MSADGRQQQVEHLLSKIVTLKSNPHYRMADVVYRRGLRYQDSTEKVLALPEFDGTILKNYISTNGDIETPNIPLLSKLIDRAIAARHYPVPQPDELVVHIRAGDVIQHQWFLQGSFAEKIGRYEDLRSCRLVVCFAFQEYLERGWWLFTEEKLRRNKLMMAAFLDHLLAAHERIDFDIVSNTEVDRDFAYMTTSSHFIRDEGGFSELVDDVRAYRAGCRDQV